MISILNENAVEYIDDETEKIGIVFPIHMNSTPRVVTDFIKLLVKIPRVYFFAVATHGGIPGVTGLYLNDILKKQSIDLNGYFEVEMINNTPKGVAPKFLMRLNWEEEIIAERVESVNRDADSKVKIIAEKIKNNENTTLQYPASFKKKATYHMMKIIWKLSENSRPKLDFILDVDACTGCGVCERVCTTKRIRIIDEKPKWVGDNCNYCYACFNFCKEQAIGVEHYTKKLGRYKHPLVHIEDISNQGRLK